MYARTADNTNDYIVNFYEDLDLENIPKSTKIKNLTILMSDFIVTGGDECLESRQERENTQAFSQDNRFVVTYTLLTLNKRKLYTKMSMEDKEE